MATNTQTTDYKVVKTDVMSALLQIAAAISRFGSMTNDERVELSKTMRTVNEVWGKYRTLFDATVKDAVESGRVKLGDPDKGTGILPVRAFRRPDAEKPGRKAVEKSDAQLLAEALGLDITG